jgi:signal transduction histidine kinase
VLAWFILSLVIVSPLAWFFARRIVLPLEGFAQAAEMLGRDPSATIIPLKGPAEIGRAAHAFNQMHNRLRAFVDDRTAMVGAISHDLRTPSPACVSGWRMCPRTSAPPCCAKWPKWRA